jgi:exopolysaccharide/PEP-CTERM locus tyrosine autokinase
MTHIEDALQKIQRAQRPAGGSAAQPRLATAIGTKEPGYGGLQIVVDTAQLRANGLLAPDAEERRLAEQYRTIKRPLLTNAAPAAALPMANANLVAVVSALPGEGKTFTCLNLCLSIARERDWSVVLVDADCSKPHLTRMFSAEDKPGLIDLLKDPSRTFDSLVMPTDVPGFSLLPAGSHDHHASELLASRRMDELCAELSGRPGRMVVFDSSPLLLTTEAVVLASKVGQVVFVVKANQTPQDAVKAALEKVDNAKAIGCVLNQSWGTQATAEGYGYYGYGGGDVTAPRQGAT